MMPILNELGIQTRWEVIEGDEQFFDITKKIHNALQGNREIITKKMWQHHFEVNKKKS
jgi:trehalose synthase